VWLAPRWGPHGGRRPTIPGVWVFAFDFGFALLD
jgi:hypothetical protein